MLDGLKFEHNVGFLLSFSKKLQKKKPGTICIVGFPVHLHLCRPTSASLWVPLSTVQLKLIRSHFGAIRQWFNIKNNNSMPLKYTTFYYIAYVARWFPTTF
jgi:hypothetical protein